MKQLLIIAFIFITPGLSAQLTPKPDTLTKKTAPVVQNNISISSSVNTTVTDPKPVVSTSSNTNPTTGTVISLGKTKNPPASVNPLGTSTLETGNLQVTDTSLRPAAKSKPAKKVQKKKKG